MTVVEQRLSELLHADRPAEAAIDVGAIVTIAARQHRRRVVGSIAAVAVVVGVAIAVPVSVSQSGPHPETVTVGGPRHFGAAIIQPTGIYIDKGADETFVPPSESQLADPTLIQPASIVRRIARQDHSSVAALRSSSFLYIGVLGLQFHADNAPAYGFRDKSVFHCPPRGAENGPPPDPHARCVHWTFYGADNGHFLDSTAEMLPNEPTPLPTILASGRVTSSGALAPEISFAPPTRGSQTTARQALDGAWLDLDWARGADSSGATARLFLARASGTDVGEPTDAWFVTLYAGQTPLPGAGGTVDPVTVVMNATTGEFITSFSSTGSDPGRQLGG